MRLGDTPYIHRGYQKDPHRLWYSDISKALILPVTIPGGFGRIPAGAVMGIIQEGNRAGMAIPTSIAQGAAVVSGLKTLFGGVYLLAQGSNSEGTFDVALEDSYKLAVADQLVGIDDNSTLDVGAITAIDRTTYSNKAVVTGTLADVSALLPTDGAFVTIQTKTATAYQAAVGILANDIDAGVGVNAKGAQAEIVVKNAILYTASIYNLDAAAATALGAVTMNEFTIL